MESIEGTENTEMRRDSGSACRTAAPPPKKEWDIDCCAVLLRGGKSRRMGTDKALLPWKGGTFVQAVAGQLDFLQEKYLSVSPSQLPAPPDSAPDRNRPADTAEPDLSTDMHPDTAPGRSRPDPAFTARDGLADGWIVLPDIVPGCGPMGGIYTALSFCRAKWALAVSCDLPAVDERLFRILLENRTENAQIVYPVTQDGRMHPACALYSRDILPSIKSRIEAGDYRLRSLLSDCISKPVLLREYPDAAGLEAMLTNINTREDLKRALH